MFPLLRNQVPLAPDLHLTLRSSCLLAYGFPTGLPVVCLWHVNGMSMVCLWFIYGLSMVSICPDQSTRINFPPPIVDANNVPSRARNVRCPKDIYLMAEEVLGIYIYIHNMKNFPVPQNVCFFHALVFFRRRPNTQLNDTTVASFLVSFALFRAAFEPCFRGRHVLETEPRSGSDSQPPPPPPRAKSGGFSCGFV